MASVKITMKAARINKGYTQEQAAALLGISTQTLVNYEKGKTSPKYHTSKKMALVYGIPLDMLDFSVRKSSPKSNKGE